MQYVGRVSQYVQSIMMYGMGQSETFRGDNLCFQMNPTLCYSKQGIRTICYDVNNECKREGGGPGGEGVMSAGDMRWTGPLCSPETLRLV